MGKGPELAAPVSCQFPYLEFLDSFLRHLQHILNPAISQEEVYSEGYFIYIF